MDDRKFSLRLSSVHSISLTLSLSLTPSFSAPSQTWRLSPTSELSLYFFDFHILVSSRFLSLSLAFLQHSPFRRVTNVGWNWQEGGVLLLELLFRDPISTCHCINWRMNAGQKKKKKKNKSNPTSPSSPLARSLSFSLSLQSSNPRPFIKLDFFPQRKELTFEREEDRTGRLYHHWKNGWIATAPSWIHNNSFSGMMELFFARKLEESSPPPLLLLLLLTFRMNDG